MISPQLDTDNDTDLFLSDDAPGPPTTTSPQQPQVVLPCTQLIHMTSSTNIQLEILPKDLKTDMKAKTASPRTQRAMVSFSNKSSITNKERCAKHRQKKKIQKQEEAKENKRIIQRNQELKIHAAYLLSSVTQMKEEMRAWGWI